MRPVLRMPEADRPQRAAAAQWRDVDILPGAPAPPPTLIRIAADDMVAAWRRTALLVAGYLLWVFGWYGATLWSIASMWYHYSTYTHGFVIVPVAAWLIWRKRAALAGVAPMPSTSVLPLLALIGAVTLWFAGELADVLPVRQLAVVTLIVAGVWLIVGDRAARVLAFPLGFLYLAVPFGDAFIPTMMEWTADFTIAALRASGVPVWREGMTFQIPTGSWSVVEACSGIRYLIASLTVGVLYAYLSYRSLGRRLAFVLASVLVPVVANWLRAYMIVMIGHLSGNRLAVGIDHIIYGWLFFGVVMMLLFWVGGFWREDQKRHVDAGSESGAANELPVWNARRSPHIAIGVAFVMVVAGPAAARLLDQHDARIAVNDTSPPQLGAWAPVAEPLVPWTPQFLPPRSVIASTYAHGQARAGLYVALYYGHSGDGKLVSSMNQLLRTTDTTAHQVPRHVASEQLRNVSIGGATFEIRETLMRLGGVRVLARSWFCTDHRCTANPIRAKVEQMLSRLRGHGNGGAIVVVYATIPDEGRPESAALDDLTREAAARLPELLASRLRGGEAQ